MDQFDDAMNLIETHIGSKLRAKQLQECRDNNQQLLQDRRSLEGEIDTYQNTIESLKSELLEARARNDVWEIHTGIQQAKRETLIGSVRFWMDKADEYKKLYETSRQQEEYWKDKYMNPGADGL